MTTALIDGDLVAFRCAASANNDPLDVAQYRCDKLMRDLLHETNAESYQVFISTSSNFRKEINPEYKANRKDEPPRWLQDCKEFLLTEWNAKTREFYEADDLLGIAQWSDYQFTQNSCTGNEWGGLEPEVSNELTTVIVSLDKDLKMIPGNHYSWEISTEKWVKPAERTTTTILGGLQNFYAQMLIGDRTDNVFGVVGIGPVKAKRYLEGALDEQDMFDTVYNLYNDPLRFLMNGVCLWICRKEGETWAQYLKNSELIIPSELEPTLDQMLESMKFFTKTIDEQ